MRKTVSLEEQIMLIQGQIAEHILISRQMEAIVFIILRIVPSFSWGILSHVTR